LQIVLSAENGTETEKIMRLMRGPAIVFRDGISSPRDHVSLMFGMSSRQEEALRKDATGGRTLMRATRKRNRRHSWMD